MPTVQRLPRKDSSARSKGDNYYQSNRWKSLRTLFFSIPENVLCFYCNLSGIIRVATTGDHFRPRRLFPELQDDITNLRGACDHCDAKKRAWEKTIATKEQFEQKIEQFINETFRNNAKG